MDHATRLTRLMESRDHPLLVTALVNIRYLTGFTGSSAYLVVGPERSVFLTDGRYAEVAAEHLEMLPATELELHAGQVPGAIAAACGDAATVDVEADHVAWSFALALKDTLSADVVPTTGVVEALRRVKDADEVAALRAAAAAGDRAFSVVDELLDTAATEGELGLGLINAMRAAGGDQAGWPPIVAVGPNAARPHHRAGDGSLADGLLLMDYGCTVDGYHSDMTRTVWLGDEDDPEMAAVYAAVLEANQAGIAAVAPGVPAHDVDDACRSVLAAHGYGDHFVHSTGHGVGLEIHEGPSVRKGSDDVLEVGHVITIEPGAYLPGRGGVRIEDMVLVTEDGHEVLTESSREFRQ